MSAVIYLPAIVAAYVGTLTITGLIALVGAGVNSTVLTGTVSGEAAARYIVNANGTMGWGDGTNPTDTNLYRAFTSLLQTDSSLNVGGDLAVTGAGKGLRVKEGGGAARLGVATLAAGSVVVPCASVSASTRIIATVQQLGTVTAPKAIAVTARTAGTSFTITSADAPDTSTVAWMAVEPA